MSNEINLARKSVDADGEDYTQASKDINLPDKEPAVDPNETKADLNKQEGTPVERETNVDPATPKPDKPKETSNDLDFSKLEKVTVETEEGDKDLFVNTEGDYINEKGEVVYTKDQLDTDTPNEYDKFFESVEIPILDDAGNPKEYDKSVDGIAQYTKDLYQTAVAKTLESNNEDVFYTNLFTKHPVIKDAIDYLESNGSLKGFNADVDVNAELTEDNKETQRAFIRKDRLDKGETAEEAEEYIKYLEEVDKLYSTATTVKDRIIKSKQQAEQQNRIKQEQDYVRTWGLSPKDHSPVKGADNSVYDLIFNKKTLVLSKDQEITIPDTIRVKEGNSFTPKSREDFFRFMYDKVPKEVDGQVTYLTEYEYKKHQDSIGKNINHELYDAYKLFVNYDPLSVANKDTDKEYKEAKKKLKLKTGLTSSGTSNNNKLKLRQQIKD